jgi:type III secretion protein L
MAMIRQADVQSFTRDAVVLNLGDLLAQGEAIKARARAEAAEITAAARQERERIMKGAREEGLALGKKDGLAQGLVEGRAQGQAEALAQTKERLAALDDAWTKTAAEFGAGKDEMLASARRDVLRLACAIAERVVKRAVSLDPTLVRDQVAAALEQVGRATRVRVLVHPDDEPLVREALPSLAACVGGEGQVTLAGEASLSRGSCVVRTVGGGVIDASLETQLDTIARVLLPDAGSPDARTTQGDAA